jgi:adenine-specific DNA-methyltransferase
MKGFVPTPVGVVDLMVEKLFRARPPASTMKLLDPGCGRGVFIDGIIRWCQQHDRPLPRIIGIESDPEHFAVAAQRFAGLDQVQIRHADFLRPSEERFDFVIGNPPYVPITGLSAGERESYRRVYRAARGRFDLYLLFFEQAMGLLGPEGRLVFITPEKFLYVDTARPLREMMRGFLVDELHFLDEQTFGGLVTYPLISVVEASGRSRLTRVLHRDGRETAVTLDRTTSWLPAIMGVGEQDHGITLGDICDRVSCGVATGADSVFTIRDAHIDQHLRRFAYPTIAGRELAEGKPLRTLHSLLLPYSTDGALVPEHRLGGLGRHLSDPARREMLLARTCVARKPWYAYHETPPMEHLLRPKLLCKDITATPFFVADREGRVIPRHSVYYVVPKDPESVDSLTQYLNSPPAREWLRQHCQRAANGFLRVQSNVLRRVPIPERLLAHRRLPPVRKAG